MSADAPGKRTSMPSRCGLALQGGALFPVADQDQSARPAPGAQLAGRLEQVPVALVGLEIGHAQQDRMRRLDAGRSEFGEGGLREPVVHNGDLLLRHPLVRPGVLGHGLGVRDEQVSDPGRETLGRQQERPVLLEEAEAPPACHQHRHPGDPRGGGRGDVAVEEECVQDVHPVLTEPADQGQECGHVRRHVAQRREAAKSEVDDGHAGLPEGFLARTAVEHDQHAGVDSAFVKAAREQDHLLLSPAEAELPDHQTHLRRPVRPPGRRTGRTGRTGRAAVR